MSRLQKILITGVLAVEALVFLLPATLLYLGALLLTINVAFGVNHNGVDATFLLMVPLLLVPGYGLFSLWWLVMKHQDVCWREVPRRIRGGLAGGVIAAVLGVFAFLLPESERQNTFLPDEAGYVMMLLVSMGPLLVAFTAILAITRPWQGKPAPAMKAQAPSRASEFEEDDAAPAGA